MAKISDFSVENDGVIVVGPETGNCISPYRAVVVPKKNQLYATMQKSAFVAVLDRNTLALEDTIRLPGVTDSLWPEAAYDDKSEKVFITSPKSRSLFSINTINGEVSRLGDDWESPGQVRADGSGSVFMAHGGGNEVIQLDGLTGEITERIAVNPWPIALDIDAKRGRVYVACQHANLLAEEMFKEPGSYPDGTLCSIDLKKSKMVGEVEVGRRPTGVAVDTKTGLVYVTEFFDNYISVVDPQAGKLVRRINLKCGPYGIEYDPDSGLIFVMCVYGDVFDTLGQASLVAVIDPGKNKVLRYLNAGKLAHQVTVDSELGVVYAGHEDTGDVMALKIDTGELVASTPILGVTEDMMVNYPEEHLLFLPCHYIESCLVVNTESRSVVANLHGGGWLSSVVVNRQTGNVFVNNEEDGEVSVFDALSGKRLVDVNLGVGVNLVHRQWGDIGIDEKRNRVYVYLSRRSALAAIDGKRHRLDGRTYLQPFYYSEPQRHSTWFKFQIAVNENNGRVYVADPLAHVMSVVDGESMELLGCVDLSSLKLPVNNPERLGGPPIYSNQNNINVDSSRHLIYAWNAIIDDDDLKVIGQLPEDACTGVSLVDKKEKRIYCHGLNGLTVLDAENYDELGNVPIDPDKKSMPEFRTMWTVEPENNRIYRVYHTFNTGNKIEVLSIK